MTNGIALVALPVPVLDEVPVLVPVVLPVSTTVVAALVTIPVPVPVAVPIAHPVTLTTHFAVSLPGT